MVCGHARLSAILIYLLGDSISTNDPFAVLLLFG